MSKKKDLGKMSKFIFRAPSPLVTVVLLIVLSAVIAFLLSLTIGYFTILFIFFSVASLSVAAVQRYVIFLLKGNTYMRRTILLTAMAYFFIIVILVIGNLTSYLLGINTIVKFALIGMALGTWFEIIVIISVSTSSLARGIVVASIYYTILSGGLLYILYQSYIPDAYVIYALILFVFAAVIAYFTFKLISLPFKKIIGIGGPMLLKFTLDHITENDDYSRARLEELFTYFSVKKNIDVFTISFKNKNKTKGMFIVPSIHPGPFFKLGSSNLPEKLYLNLKETTENVLVFHGASNHADNMASSVQVDKIAQRIMEGAKQSPCKNCSTPLISLDGSSLKVMKYGDLVIYIGSRSPKPTDDVDRSIGKLIDIITYNELSCHGVYIDGHNTFHKTDGRITYETEDADRLLADVKKAINIIKGVDCKPFKIGFGNSRISDDDSVAPMGFQVTTFEIEGKRYGLLLIDANNILKDTYQALSALMKKHYANFEILSTDNHYVNATSSGHNPFGTSNNLHSKEIESAINKSILDLEYSDVCINIERIKDIDTFGDSGYIKLENALTMSYYITSYTLALNGILLFILSLLPLLIR